MPLSARFKCGLGVGISIFLLGCVSLVALQFVINYVVKNSVALRNGTETYRQFLSPSIPTRMQIYVWDLANVQEVLLGDRPYLVERGPFTYAEVRIKFNITYDPEKDWITFKQNRTFIFLRNESVADDSTLFTTANLPIITILDTLRHQPSFIRKPLADLLAAFPNETFFVRKSVRDIAFGYSDPLLKLAMKFLPSVVYTDFVGVMAGLNHTFDGVYTIVAGNQDVEHLGEIQYFNGSRKLPFWTSKLANRIVGSDGTLAPPFLNKSAMLPCFTSDICRSVVGVYAGDLRVAGGITAWKFEGPDYLMDNATLYPPNAGYCTPKGNCLPSGLVNLTVCKVLDGLHVPIVISLPHFLLADPQVKDAVYGMRPDNGTHRTYVAIEPLTGIVVQVEKRLQINVHLQHDPAFSHLGSVQTMFYPVLWMNESAVLDEATAAKLNSQLFTPKFIAYFSASAITVIGALLTILLGVLSFYSLKNSTAHSSTVPSISREEINSDCVQEASNDDDKEVLVYAECKPNGASV